MIIDRKKLVRYNIEKLKQGYSAYCESQAIAEMMDKEIANLNLRVHVDRTHLGNWYIPLHRPVQDNEQPASSE